MGALLQSGGFLMPLIICSVISTVILWYCRTKNPVKRFRPHFGEIAVLGIVLYGMSIGASYFVYTTITTGQEKIEDLKKMPEKMGPGKTEDSNTGSGGSSVFEETLSNIESDRRSERDTEN